jgi:nucleotide-binding universal stress UspA family protein
VHQVGLEETTMAVFKKILFPTDFSENAGKALAHAMRLADFGDGEVIVQHVVHDFFSPHRHWATLFDIHEMQKSMDGYVDMNLADLLPKDTGRVKVRTVVSKGKPADSIAVLAEKEQVDLVVMGSAKGVVTNQVIRMTNRPVLAVSAKQPELEGTALHKVDRILVATDFSNHSRKVVEYAFDLKRALNASIYMLYVIETSRAIEFAFKQSHFTDTMTKMREWATSQLVNLTPDQFINDDSVIRIVQAGSPEQTIADVAFEIGADLTILGTHEYGAAHKYLLGTTTDRLLNRTSTPVLTVKL